jgi:GNAT superfamily N-acetyltransferase
MSLFAAYQKELWSYETIEVEAGFICYQEFPEHIYLAELYVSPDLRRSGLATRLTKQVENLAREKRKRHLISRIDLAQGGSAESLRAHLAYGFSPYLAEAGKIWLKKELIYE